MPHRIEGAVDLGVDSGLNFSEMLGDVVGDGVVESVKAQLLKKRSLYEYYSAELGFSGASGGTNAPGAGPVGGGVRVPTDSVGQWPPL